MEREQARRKEVLRRDPTSYQIFPSLLPDIQAYIILEHQKELAGSQEEKKQISATLSLKSTTIFTSPESRQDITRWSEAISQALEEA